MRQPQQERRVIRIEEYSPGIPYALWVLALGVVLWFLLPGLSLDVFLQRMWLVFAAACIVWVLLTDRGLVVDLDQIDQTIVRRRIGLWGTTFGDEVQVIAFSNIKRVELKRTIQGFGRGSHDDYRVRLRLNSGGTVDLTKPVRSLQATSKRALSIAAAIGLDLTLHPVD